MYTVTDLSKKLKVSVKTVRRHLKNNGIQPVDKDGKTSLYDDHALAVLQDAIQTKRSKHEAVVNAGVANINKSTNTPAESVQVQERLEQLDKSTHTLAGDEYAKAIANQVTEMLKSDTSVNKAISLLTVAVNRGRIIDQQHDELVAEIRRLDDKVDGLYDRLLHNMRHFNYRKMAQINTQEFLKVVSKQQDKGNGQASKQVKEKEKESDWDKGQGA
ncbi:helix-turn-helix domain-containing protein [Limosilactobacillus viscerum]|uniref:helix-turn-helix domain-containing protein n=1 Tax=Limosilactobacillus viscerum TaxID=2993450 RepID=UPI002DD68A9C|nr:helix-turn-helix domain-containing protein [Limosilactobacillus viscerum]